MNGLDDKVQRLINNNVISVRTVGDLARLVGQVLIDNMWLTEGEVFFLKVELFRYNASRYAPNYASMMESLPAQAQTVRRCRLTSG